MRRKTLFMAILIALVCTISPKTTVASDKSAILVTPAWLSDHLNDPNLVVLNVAQNARAYRNGHVPGARFLWVTKIAASNPELSFELVPVEQLDTLLEGLGISNDSRIVLCGVNGNVSPTARTYITLEYLGMAERTYILD